MQRVLFDVTGCEPFVWRSRSRWWRGSQELYKDLQMSTISLRNQMRKLLLPYDRELHGVVLLLLFRVMDIFLSSVLDLSVCVPAY